MEWNGVTISKWNGQTISKWNGLNVNKWSGLTGFCTWYSRAVNYGDTWLANGFTQWRDLRDYADTENIDASKVAVIAANAKGLKAIWGVHAGETGITAANWGAFETAILAAAQWAQDNGVYEFQIGNEELNHNDNTTMTNAELIIELKDTVTAAQAIFTNGKVTYSCHSDHRAAWETAGKGDIDLLAFNIYMGTDGAYGDEWKGIIDDFVSAFGIDGIYITEFAPSSSSIEDYSADEAVQAAGVTEMINYIRASGIERALFYTWKDYTGGIFGVIKADDTYRLLWNSLINSG